jgi:FkbM family methyltransferase
MIEEFRSFCKSRESYSQLNQDLLVLFFLGDAPGYFVEFGACDGIYFSNTFLLETYHSWSGILVEPSPYYNKVLKEKRSSKIDTLCVSDKSGDSVDFVEVDGTRCLSGIYDYAFNDMHSEARRSKGVTYKVDTISLKDLLDKHDAPNVIDYISIDTEGSEYSILKAYDFSRVFKVISVEHNSTYQKPMIDSLLTSYGYVNVFPEESKWDGWYVLSDVYESAKAALNNNT